MMTPPHTVVSVLASIAALLVLIEAVLEAFRSGRTSRFFAMMAVVLGFLLIAR